MSYYLKKTKLKGRTYLSIDESFYSRKKKGTAHRVYRSLGSVETLKEKGMEDPIAYYQNEVNMLNAQAVSRTSLKIGDSPARFLGYFPLKSVMEKIDIPQFLKYLNIINGFEYDMYDVLSSLVYAFAVCPYTRARRSFSEIIPLLHQPPASSGEQFEEGVSFLGNNYEKFVELFSTGVRQHYTLNTGNLYYSCLDFYFEIGPEADPVPKSGSIESGRSLYVGMSILFDDDQIPVGMRFYRGDQSDFHMSREAVSRLKEQFGVRGRTVRVADNTLDCAESINRAVESGHGYLFSRPVSRITEEEKDRVLMESGDWHRVKDRNGALAYMYRTCTGKYPYTFIQKDGTARTFTVEEKRLLTWRPALARRQRAETDRLVEKAKACYAVTADIREYGDAARYVRILPAGAQGGTPAAAGLDWDAIERDRALAGYSLVVTSERKMSTRKMYEVISSARHTEESFRIMKSDLDLRPAHSLNTESVLGHFLVCYIAVLLERLFQHCELKDEYSGREIFEFMRSFRVVRTAEDFFNMTPKSAFVTQFSERAKLPLDHLNLTEKQIKKILSYRC